MNCPKCNGPISCLAGRSVHPSNWYCKNKKCGWQAWDYDIPKEKSKSPFDNFINSLPEFHWSKYDLLAVKLGWDAAIKYKKNESAVYCDRKRR